MSKNIIYAVGISFLSLQLLGCGGETTDANDEKVDTNKIVDGELCDYIEGRTYYTVELGEAGRTQTGIRLGHWSARFSEGEAFFLQSDFGLAGTYTCENDKVILAMEGKDPVSLTFDHGEDAANSHYQSFLYNPFEGDEKRYLAADVGEDRYEDCQLVEGRSYSAINTATGPDDPIPVEMPFIRFGEGQTVEYDIVASGQAPTMGIYECDLGEIHLHSDASDTNPVRIQLNDDNGDTLTAMQGDFVIEMAVSGSICAEEPAQKWCVVEPQDIQCVTTPCPIGVHKTVLASACDKGLAEPFVLVHEGSCGDLEGQPYYDEPVGCTKEYAPVCAAVRNTEPCDTIPCPKLVHKTFANSCVAGVAQAHRIHQGECTKEEEGAVVTEDLTGACPAVLDPVCAKNLTPVVCVTEPCPNYEYQTFGNGCEAFLSLAEVAFDGECGELEQTMAFGNPLVKRTDELPSTEKTVILSNVRFDGDVLNVSLGYSGCDEQHFHFYVSDTFMESLPVQVANVFVPLVEDECLAAFNTEFSYDLTPLKHAYQQAYQTETGTIELPGIGTYSF